MIRISKESPINASIIRRENSYQIQVWNNCENVIIALSLFLKKENYQDPV